MPTLAEVQERLALYKEAERKILTDNQAYQIGDQQFTKASIMFVQREIRYLEEQLAMLSAGGSAGCRPVVFGGRR
ncbi:hypothetical protein [Desulfofustis limnaeus]|uniref:Uncharacterized protein n=1 Tax=Desulfofustis limnaeus TaxID=2740163 RepID=A0ABM7WCR1_9BACT|nr:hypothetical protein [Desulfofustis limnaeus]BDD88711.1 hypothetical protein DPPLL_30760 [Desulfofustis limnaeus]